MGPRSFPDLVLSRLRARPSVASVVAIGHYHVLNGGPIRTALAGLEALAEMPCDWAVAILDQVITSPSRKLVVRRQAVSTLRFLLLEGIDRGYEGVTEQAVSRQANALQQALGRNSDLGPTACQVLDDLCDHLNRAIEEGLLGVLPEV